MSRIWTLLLWGLLISVLLHWVALDLWRGSGLFVRSSTAPALQVHLRDERRIEPVAATPEVPLPTATTGLKEKPAGQTAPSAVPIAESSRSELVQAAAHTPETLPGLRSGKSPEAMVALRIALAQALSSESWPAGVGAHELWCDFDAAGHLSGVRSAAADATLAARVQAAATKLRPPEVLIGNAFSLDILLEF